ncbi:MAG: copper amine oxidase N-terminal domain-containing protein, partial [Thermacetogeniaceae bacterium]
ALENPTIVAGKVGSTIGKFQITEGIGGSLIAGRTITLALPTNVVWSQYPVVDTANSTLNGLTLGAWAPVGSDGTTIKASVTGASAAGTGATVVFKSIQVTPAVDFSGNVDVTVGGSEGLTGTLTLGKVAAGITAAVSTSPDVKIGLAAQATGDLTISEVAAGNIDSLQNFAVLGATYLTRTGTGSQATITVNAPDGVAFAATPTVTVTAGDLQLGTVTSDTGIVTIPIKSNSVTASTIKVSGIQITLDRTVPEGPVVFKIKGTGVNETTQGTLILAAGESVLFPNSATAAKVAAANVITPAPGESTGTAVFKIGATSYTLNGASATLDAAPYIKNGRTLLPVRAIANAVGVSDDNIIWDPAGKVTIIKGDRVVQLTIGSNVLLVNGAAITIEVAPEITAGRTFLPLRALAQALSASIAWDATAQTVTVTF